MAEAGKHDTMPMYCGRRISSAQTGASRRPTTAPSSLGIFSPECPMHRSPGSMSHSRQRIYSTAHGRCFLYARQPRPLTTTPPHQPRHTKTMTPGRINPDNRKLSSNQNPSPARYSETIPAEPPSRRKTTADGANFDSLFSLFSFFSLDFQ